MAAEEFAEVIGTPYDVWTGPVGTPFPDVDTPVVSFDAAWFHMGTNGIDNQGSDGVTVNLGETISNFTPAGGTLPVKGWRTEEAVSVAFSLVDLTVDQLAVVMDDAEITTVAATTGHAGKKSMSLIRGIQLAYFAVLVRGLSPYDDGTGLIAQWKFSRCYQSANQAPKYVKGTPAEVACEYTICGTVNADDPGLYDGQTAAKL